MDRAGKRYREVYSNSMSDRSSYAFLSLLLSMCAPTNIYMVFLCFTDIALILPVYCTFQYI